MTLKFVKRSTFFVRTKAITYYEPSIIFSIIRKLNAKVWWSFSELARAFSVDTLQDFLIKMGIKLRTHLLLREKMAGPQSRVLGFARLRLNDGAKLWVSFKLCFKTNDFYGVLEIYQIYVDPIAITCWNNLGARNLPNSWQK